MKKINDAKIYMVAAITAAILSLMVMIPSCYSFLVVEPKITKLLDSKERVGEQYKEAYLLLRNPFIFARYDNFDTEGITVKNSIAYFDRWIYEGQDLSESHKEYLKIILNRREKGSHLGRYTSVFLLCISILSLLVFFIEKKSDK